MNELVKSFNQEDYPEVISLDFPGYDARGLKECRIKNPRSQWIHLAREKAGELGISFQHRNTEIGLDVAFLSSTDASRLLAAIAPHWKERLLEGISFTVEMMCEMDIKAGNDPTPTMQSLADEYGLDLDDVRGLVEKPQPPADWVSELPVQAYDG